MYNIATQVVAGVYAKNSGLHNYFHGPVQVEQKRIVPIYLFLKKPGGNVVTPWFYQRNKIASLGVKT